jgi:hypothetical protein
MTNAEKALVFQHNKMALASANLNQRACLLTLANLLNLMLVSESGLADWERKLLRNWANFDHLKILSWHDAKGDSIINMMNATDPSILKSIQNGKKDDIAALGLSFSTSNWNRTIPTLQQSRQACRHPALFSAVNTISNFRRT